MPVYIPKSDNGLCTSCDGPRNHYVDGKLQKRCAGCNDKSKTVSVYKTRAVGRSVDPIITGSATALLVQIDDMLDQERYEWALDTLLGIKDTVLRTRIVTEGQQRAVDNIENARRAHQ